MAAPLNPFEKDGKWYWYDETGDDSPPFDTEQEAKDALDRYCKYFFGDRVDVQDQKATQSKTDSRTSSGDQNELEPK